MQKEFRNWLTRYAEFPRYRRRENYLEAYSASRLAEYQKSHDYKTEVGTIVGPYLRFAFKACKRQFVAQGYPPAGKGTNFLNFDLVVDTTPGPFDKPISIVETPPAESYQKLWTAEAEVRDDTGNTLVTAAEGEVPSGGFPEPMVEDVPRPSRGTITQDFPIPMKEAAKVAKEKAPTVG
ncbi:UNVERIFIED_CONTAM: hypothetical protein Slati_2424700 [Sesamum latifolium]|uniref:Uncharacterized protein n=1 Tax=Sesamum latifolium TaxID=2727402 RepID=A0AAW2WCN8_9LAMI